MYYNNYNFSKDNGSNVKPRQYAKMQTSKLRGELNGYKAGVKAALGGKNDATELSSPYQAGLTSGRPIVGGLGGSLLGAGIGALAGNALGNTGLGAGIGALSGAALGTGAGLAFNHKANTPANSGKLIGMTPRKALSMNAGNSTYSAPVEGMVAVENPIYAEGKQVGVAHTTGGYHPSRIITNDPIPNPDARIITNDPIPNPNARIILNASQQVNNLLALKRLARLSGRQDFSSINDLAYRLYMFY